MKKVLFNFLFLLLTFNFLLLTLNISAQKKGAVRDTFLLRYHSPNKATLYSAILPGLGQAYNHKYWKIPIIYAGAVTIYEFVKFNSKYYRFWKNVYSSETTLRNSPTYNVANDPYPNNTLSDFETLRNYYQKDLQLTYIIAAGIYVVNILDAAVDANLFDYDISDKLTLSPAPIYCPSYDKNLNFALGLTFKFKFL